MAVLARSLILAITVAVLVSAAAASADVLQDGNWNARLTGGDLKLGDGVLPAGRVVAGTATSFSIPPYTSAPVGFNLAGASAHFGNFVREAANGTGNEYTASGAVDLSVIGVQVDPLTGNLIGALTASGTITVAGRTLSQGQQTGSISGTCEVREAATPAPVPLAPASGNSGGTPWSIASGAVTITDPGSAIPVICANLPATVASELLGSTEAGHNVLSLGALLTPADAPAGVQAPSTVIAPGTPNPPVTPRPPIGPQRRPCAVPFVRGKLLDAAKKAIKKAGCDVGRIKRKRRHDLAPETVMKQTPAAGKIKSPGYHVRLVVSK
jgi:hypothetical protein